MDNAEILKHIDHTLLKAVSDEKGILDICKEAVEHKTASVCIPPSYVKLAKEKYPSLNVCTVIGFPLGYSTTAVKVFETEDAVKNGADEIDMVINIGDVKNGSFDKVTEEISAVRKAAEGKILKVIIETCYLTEEEKIRLCKCVTDGGADYIKTSTGFGTAGAQKEDIVLFKNNIGKDVKIKAAGGIRTKEAMEEFIELGCDRIGTSGANLLF
ncbi:deoxyribose-phosphate aldolase [Anaerotignum sp. MSJ-24]|uniref:deoxyribose-phosphate aldolase n=1 Tax=Anaerotignum sp. MSJ-24 TaxID=2841521 RepID=UPI001C11BEA6|nr:deoxyribose-phosphate aldolase [Anaerotignum sp. MSJ-24]MBU5464986.1 deoxyribose-phosphate aldolase [Anaerotignum sp. MSJ-24]